MTRRRSEFDQLVSGKWDDVARTFQNACCDCLLVHRFTFRLSKGGYLQFRAVRDDRATAKLRRSEKAKACPKRRNKTRSRRGGA